MEAHKEEPILEGHTNKERDEEQRQKIQHLDAFFFSSAFQVAPGKRVIKKDKPQSQLRFKYKTISAAIITTVVLLRTSLKRQTETSASVHLQDALDV